MQSAVFLLLLALVSGLPAWADPPENYVFHPYDEALHSARDTGRKVFIYFGREGCGYCDLTNRTAFVDPRVRERYQQNYELAYVDSEGGQRLTLPSGERIVERELGPRFQAFVTPVFVFAEADGTPILRRVGVQKTEDLLAAERFVAGGFYRRMNFEEFRASGE
ncbi:MAG: thioredoxin fold domain-containing protein [Gammaproteobacteria bacterium]|jgi:thioredoxin-related protein|nr:thioredoxin fold domain-containing protein [Gammaproteobacteria bacterium]